MRTVSEIRASVIIAVVILVAILIYFSHARPPSASARRAHRHNRLQGNDADLRLVG